MNGNDTPVHETNMQPGAGSCYGFSTNSFRSKKSIWLVPHVIKHKDDSEVITWRCNWGNTCESQCLYAMNKGKNVAGAPL